MLKARNKKLSMLLVLAMLMTMFVGVGTASAADYKGSIQPYLQQGANNVMPGQIIMKWDFMAAAPNDHVGIITLPSGLEFDAALIGATGGLGATVNLSAMDPALPANLATVVATPAGAAPAFPAPACTWLSNKEIMVTLAPGAGNAYTDVTVQVIIPPVDVDADAQVGAANATISHLEGLFAPGSAHIANISGGQVLTSVLDTVTFNDGVPATVSLTITEDSRLGLKDEAGTLKLKLPKGYTFDLAAPAAATVVDVATAAAPVAVDATAIFTSGTNGMRLSADSRTLYLDRDDVRTPAPAPDTNTPGKSIYRISFGVVVDALEAQVGDCEIGISGKSTVMPGSLTIGSFADYGYTITVADEDKEILAGRDNADDSVLSKVRIKEDLGGSLLNGRSVVMTLPDGVEWLSPAVIAGPPVVTAVNIDTKTNANTMNFAGIAGATANIVNNRPNVAKATLVNGLPGTKGDMEFEARVAVAADFEGPVTIEFSGTAGINETITVGQVVKPLAATVDAIDVIIGSQDQKGADIVIKEAKAETLLATGTSTLDITAPAGVGFSKLPTVSVDGDLTIGTVTRAIGADGTRNNVLTIPIRSGSYKTPATITISDVYYSLDRTVPEGAMKLSVGGTAVNEAGITNRGSAAIVTAANCVTPAPGEILGNGEFRIDSNVYYVAGVAKVMDVAPYIKSDRTYVPMRYLGEILGAEVVWDDSARTVTLTKGDDVAVFTIGSTSYTVNGEAMTADVAPEIANDRTMLPARFVAEAFGAVVGWDAGTRTVLIQN